MTTITRQDLNFGQGKKINWDEMVEYVPMYSSLINKYSNANAKGSWRYVCDDSQSFS